MTRVVGYVWELVPGRGTESDVSEVTAAGAVEVFVDDASVHARSRPALKECIQAVGAGDALVVISATQLASTVKEFVATVAGLTSSGATFRSLNEPALSTGPESAADTGDAYVALEGLRRRFTSMQTRAGMAAAAREGRRPGRPTVMTPERIAMAVELRRFDRSISHIARVLGVSPNAVQRALAQASPPAEPS